jgi:hypothetical protein
MEWIAYRITTDDNKITIEDSRQHVITSSNVQDLLEFLYTPYRTEWQREVKFFYDVDNDMSQIFRLLNEKDCRGILETKNGGTYDLFGYKVSYSRERNFVIRGNKKVGNRDYWCCIYQIKQYLKNPTEPNNVSELFDMGIKVQKALSNIGITTPMTLNSAIAIWEGSMKTTELTMIPNMNNIPPEYTKAIEFAEQ